jgi:hypothetical protein
MNATDSPSPAVPSAPAAASRALRLATVLALLGILLSLMHLIWPSPLMFTIFMLCGQSSFGVAMLLYCWVILRDLRRRKVL